MDIYGFVRKRMHGKLRKKIFIIMALVSVVPILAASVITVLSVTASHRTDVANLESALITQKEQEIKAFMNGAGAALPAQVDQASSLTTSTEAFVLAGILKGNSAIKEISFIGINGVETSRAAQSSPNGAGLPLRDMSRSDEFLAAKAGSVYVGPVYYANLEPMATIAAPVTEKDGAILAVVAAAVSLRPVRDIIGSASLGASGYLYLVDQDGNVMASGRQGISRASLGLADQGSGNTANASFVRAVLSGKNFLGPDLQRRYANAEGEQVVAAAAFIPAYRWGLFAEWPAKEADAVVNQLLYRDFFIDLFVVLIVIGASILLATVIVRPIKTLESGTERVAEGKFEEPIDIHTHDELEELGAAFNKMMVGLKELEELRNEFVFVAAHELRTPVAAMKGYLQLILEGATGPVSEKTADFIKKVINSNKRLIQLVNDLLEVSRSQSGKLTIKVAPIAIAEPIEQVLDELKSLADNASVALVYRKSETPQVLADADRIKEVMVNLVGNAIKYMGPPEGARLRTVAIRHEISGNRLVTHVEDTGLGISKAAQEKLFQKFYRVQTDSTKDIQGTGLGLFIVKEIIEKMGGAIGVNSEEGKGSDFFFSLPVAEA